MTAWVATPVITLKTNVMKIPSTELLGLLTKQAGPAHPQAVKLKNITRVGGREVARRNELKCMKAVIQFGHLRICEMARAVWPQARYGEQVARRTVARMVEQGLLLERRNALGSRSLCVTRGGATWLNARGIEAQHTLDLSSVSGSTFFHRTLVH